MADRDAGFWSLGFRPFFLFASLHAVLVIGLWLLALMTGFELPSAFAPLSWHRHEMLFGVIAGVIAGFLLTAVPNWTGRPPLAGRGLQGLFLLWLSGRALIFASAVTGILPALILDAAFLLTLAVWAARQIRLSGNRNVPIAVVIGLLGLMNAGDYLGAFGEQDLADSAFRLAIVIVLTLILLIGGRIVPAFTRNWLASRGETSGMPVTRPRFEIGLRIAHVLVLAAWAASPDFYPVYPGLILLAGLHLFRLYGWKGWRTAPEPLLLILHIGYLWLPFGLVLLGLSGMGTSMTYSAALHALTAGLMGSMTLTVMMRASLGHGGRALEATLLTNMIFLMVSIGALLRVGAPFLPFPYYPPLGVSALLWAGAYLLFALGFLPLFLGRKG